jgi:DNA-binding NtrC family response regulator
MVDIDDPTAEPATAVAATATSPFLRVVFSGAHVLFVDHPLENARTDAGRAAIGQADLRLEGDPRCSRQHATFVVERGEVRVENKSSHGTWVNGVRVDSEAPVNDGDVIRMGDSFVVLRFLPDNPRDIKSDTLLGRSPAVMQLRTLISVVGPTRASVVLLGETGAGKEVVARSIHEKSGRKGSFVPVNCAAIPENLAESQLFGHRAGAFTGAAKDHTGFFREADGGTLFLDEVGELPLLLQPKLLRVLDEKEVFAVGSTTGVPVDVRVVAATNREITREVDRGQFRGDLFARLAEITISLPPLRARREDVLLLLESALPGLRDGKVALSPQLVSALLLHGWPFNVRELMKIATELEVKAQGRKILDVDLLEGRALGPRPNEVTIPRVVNPLQSSPVTQVPLELPKKKVEEPAPTKDVLLEMLDRYKGKVSEVARATGRSRTQVYRWLEQHGIDLEKYRRAP